MGFFSALFGHGEQSDESKYDILRDDGVRAMQMGELPHAEKCLLAALELKHELQIVGYLAEVYLRMQNNEAALPHLTEMAEACPDNVEVRLLLAQTQGKLEKYADESDTCAALIEAYPEEPRALYLAAEAAHGLQDDIHAIAHLTRALQLEPQYRSALMLRAKVLISMQQWTEALNDVDELLKADADDEEYLATRAQVLIALGRLTEAQADLEHVHELNPFSRDTVLKLGAVYEQGLLWDKALALYDDALSMMPDFAECYRARGGVKHHLHDEDGAADDLKKSLELAPEKAKELDGEYTNVENEINARYRNMNPYGF